MLWLFKTISATFRLSSLAKYLLNDTKFQVSKEAQVILRKIELLFVIEPMIVIFLALKVL